MRSDRLEDGLDNVGGHHVEAALQAWIRCDLLETHERCSPKMTNQGCHAGAQLRLRSCGSAQEAAG